METRSLEATIEAGRLNVSGEVNASGTNIEASLVRRTPQGLNKRVLGLELKFTKTASGGLTAFTWVPFAYDEPAAPGQFTQVSISSSHQPVATIDVKDSA